MSSIYDIAKKSTTFRFSSIVISSFLLIDIIAIRVKSVSILNIDKDWVSHNVNYEDTIIIIIVLSVFYLATTWIKDLYDIIAKYTILKNYFLGLKERGYVLLEEVFDISFYCENSQLYNYCESVYNEREKMKKNRYSGTFILFSVLINFFAWNIKPEPILVNLAKQLFNSVKLNSVSSIDVIFFLFFLIILLFCIFDFVFNESHFNEYIYFKNFDIFENQMKAYNKLPLKYHIDKTKTNIT